MRNVISQWALQLLRIVVAFVVNIFIARVLGPNGYGVAMSVFAYASIALLALDPGFGGAIARHTSAYLGANRDYMPLFKGHLVYKLISGVIASILFYAFSGQMACLAGIPEYAYLFQAYSIAILFYALNSVFTAYLNGINRIDLSVLYYTIGYLSMQTSALITVLSGLGVFGYVISHVIGNTALFLAYLVKFRKILIDALSRPLKTAILEFKRAIPLGLSIASVSISGYVRDWIDKFVVLGSTGVGWLGLYTIGLRFSTTFESILMAISSATMPLFGIKYGSGDLNSIRTGVKSLSDFLMRIFAPLYALAAVLTPYLIPLVYGEKFESSWVIASEHILFTAFTSFRTPYASIPVVFEAKRELVIGSIVTAISCVVLELAFLPLGPLGIALGRDLAVLIGFAYLYNALYRRIGLELDFKRFKNAIIASILIVITSLTALYLTHSWILSALAGLIVYACLIRPLGLVRFEELVLIARAIGVKRRGKIVRAIRKVVGG